MRTLVLDSWAVIAWIVHQTPAADDVQSILDQAAAGQARLLMSGINVGETYYALGKLYSGELAGLFRQLMPNMPVTVVIPGMADIWRAAEIKRMYPVSYADGFAAELGLRNKAEVMTGDPEFRSIPSLKLYWLTRT